MRETIKTGLIAILLLLFSSLNVCALELSVYAANGGSSSSFSQQLSLSDEASADGNIWIDGTAIHPSVRVVEPPKKKGMDYGEWNAKWWQWVFSMPVEEHPLFDTADESEGQEGNVWFIGSGFLGGDVNRDITIPTGTSLFVPLFNYEASTIEGNGEGQELKDNVDSAMQKVSGLSAEIDGSSLDESSFYRAPTGIFQFGPLPDNNILQFFGVNAPEGATSDSYGDGYYMMLNPLSRGDHTIKWSSSWDNIFEQNVEYNVHVEPKGQYK